MAGLLVVVAVVVEVDISRWWWRVKEEKEEDDSVRAVEAVEHHYTFRWMDEEVDIVADNSCCCAFVQVEHELVDCIVVIVFLVVVRHSHT
jgi:hypothetical protein